MENMKFPILKCSFHDDEEEEEQPIRNYNNVTLEELIEETNNTPIDRFENTRTFNPRKQRSCHRRTEPVSDELRRKESSKNSREYTKRNRTEIRTCQRLLADLEAKLNRFNVLVPELKVDAQCTKVFSAISDFEQILKTHSNVGSDVRAFLKVGDPEKYLSEYREKGKFAESIVFRTGVVSYEESLTKLIDELQALSGEKSKAHSPKDKTNHASTKSRLKQRVVRADLKVKCYNCWQSIETMRLQGAALKKCSNELKQKVWDNILGVYNGVFQLSKEGKEDRFALERVQEICNFFAPFSEGGDVINRFVPPTREVKTVVAIPPEIVTPPTILKGVPLKRSATVVSANSSPLSTPTPNFTLALPINSPTSPIEEKKIQMLTISSPKSENPKMLSPHIILTDVDGLATQLIPTVVMKEPKMCFDERPRSRSPPKRNATPELIEPKKPKLEPEETTVLAHTPEQATIPLETSVLMNQLWQTPVANNSIHYPFASFLPSGISAYLPFSPQLVSLIEQQQMIQKLLATAFSSSLKLSK